MARSVLADPRPVLSRWYPGEDEVVATVALYLLEILHRYTAQAVDDPNPVLTRRMRTLVDVADLVAGNRHPMDAERGT